MIKFIESDWQFHACCCIYCRTIHKIDVGIPVVSCFSQKIIALGYVIIGHCHNEISFPPQ